jgi:hypothetical protein
MAYYIFEIHCFLNGDLPDAEATGARARLLLQQRRTPEK